MGHAATSTEKQTCSGLDLDAQELDDEGQPPEREEDPKENFISHHAASGTFNDSMVGGEAGNREMCRLAGGQVLAATERASEEISLLAVHPRSPIGLLRVA